jgi:hypothetical protein
MGTVYTTYSLHELAQAALQSQYTEEVKQALTTAMAELPTQMYVRLLSPGSAYPTWLEHSFTIGTVHQEVKQRYPNAQFLIQSSFEEERVKRLASVSHTE